MTKEEKSLILKDISSRALYDLKIKVYPSLRDYLDDSSKGVISDLSDYRQAIFEKGFLLFRPFLRPTSSLTGEELDELFGLCGYWEGPESRAYGLEIASRQEPSHCWYGSAFRLNEVLDMRAIDWLIEKKVDFRGLIKKNLALSSVGLDIYK